MDELTVEHLAPYLPYGLKVEILNYKCDYVGIRYSKMTSVVLDQGFDVAIGYQGGYVFKTFPEYKPILRPLSDLIKEITHEGETFVPMMELSKINDPHCSLDGEFKFHDWRKVSVGAETEQYGYEYPVETTNLGTLMHELSYWKSLQRFSKRDNTRSVVHGVARQYEMFQCLFRWHFDVFGLTEKGLAVDINTLGNEKES